MLLLVPHSASAECYTYTQVAYQWTQWWDGTITYLFLGMTEYTFCEVGGIGGGTGGGPGPGSGGGGPTSYPPTVSIVHVDTTDPVNPLVVADIASNDPNDPVNVVNLEVNGTTVDYAYWSNTGFARYQLRLGAISNFADGNVGITAKACSATGVCGQSSTAMYRFTPSPGVASNTIFASWQEEDEGDEESGPGFVLRSGNYSHGLRQLYTRTAFTCSEVGENSHYQVKDSLVTLQPRPAAGVGRHCRRVRDARVLDVVQPDGSGESGGMHVSRALLIERRRAAGRPWICSFDSGTNYVVLHRRTTDLLHERNTEFSASMNPTFKLAALLTAWIVSAVNGDRPDGSRVIARSNTGRVLYRMIACDNATLSATDCHVREQQRLHRRLREQWVTAAAKKYAVVLTADEEAEVARQLAAEADHVAGAAAHFHALAVAALEIRRGKDRAGFMPELARQGITGQELDRDARLGSNPGGRRARSCDGLCCSQSKIRTRVQHAPVRPAAPTRPRQKAVD